MRPLFHLPKRLRRRLKGCLACVRNCRHRKNGPFQRSRKLPCERMTISNSRCCSKKAQRCRKITNLELYSERWPPKRRKTPPFPAPWPCIVKIAHDFVL
jgi:hypothetical protein